MIGENVTRIDAYEKATGRARYVRDLLAHFPGILYIRALRSPCAHARIRSLDTGGASQLPGVAAVLTGENAGVDWSRFPAQSRLAVRETLWAGQAIALVAAESEALAEQAVVQIRVEYEPLPHVLTWQESFRADPASIIDPDLPVHRSGRPMRFPYPNVAGEYELRRGEPEAGFSAAAVTAEGEFWTEKKVHNQMERAAAISVYESDGKISTWCNGCGVHGVIKKALLEAFPELTASRVRVVSPYTGGSFGNRNIPYVEVLSVLMALRTKRAVFLEFTREEMFTAAPSAWICATKVKLGADREGRLLAKEMRLIEEIGASSGNETYTGRLSGSSTANLYAVPNVAFSGCSLLTNTVPAGPYRGLGTPDAIFGLELLMNELAEKLQISPLEIRLRNLLKKGEQDDYGETITSIGAKECLRKVAEAIDLETPSVQDGSDWIRGKGIACCGKQNGPNGRSEADVLIYHDGSVELRVSCDNHGMGVTTALVQIAAAELGIGPDQIRVAIGDTDRTPYDNFSASSSGLYRTGGAVRLACRDAKAKLRESAARRFGIPEDLVEIRGKTAYLKGAPVDRVEISSLFEPLSMFRQDVWGLKQGTPVVGHGVFCPAQAIPWDENGRTPRMWNWFQYAATAVEIAVNRRTGQIRVLKAANAGDTGNPINPKIIEGQLEGAIHMAIGFSVQEKLIYDGNGRIQNANLGDYRLPTVLDMPLNRDVFTAICPDPLPDGPYGAKGMSESVVSAVGAAIAGALYDAVGVRVTHYPMTAETVLRLIEEKEEKEGKV